MDFFDLLTIRPGGGGIIFDPNLRPFRYLTYQPFDKVVDGSYLTQILDFFDLSTFSLGDGCVILEAYPEAF